MGFFDFFKSKSQAQLRDEQFAKIREKTIIHEHKSLMHDMIILSPHDSSCKDVHPNGFGNFGLVKTNPIPIYGIDNVAAYMDKLRYKYTSEKSGNSTYNPITYVRSSEGDETAIGSKKPVGELPASGTEAENIEGTIDIYNIYTIGNQKLAKIYVNSYSLKTSNKVPDGFYHRDEIPLVQDARILMELVNKK